MYAVKKYGVSVSVLSHATVTSNFRYVYHIYGFESSWHNFFLNFVIKHPTTKIFLTKDYIHVEWSAVQWAWVHHAQSRNFWPTKIWSYTIIVKDKQVTSHPTFTNEARINPLLHVRTNKKRILKVFTFNL